MWQVFSADVRGWGVAQNAKYGAAIGVATTVGGLITGRSVRLLGNRLHTLAWTLSTALSNLMFMSPSTRVAMGSVVFAGAEDCMQAAANARLVQAGSALGMRKGQLAADYGNLLACVRVAGLYLFGKLCAVGMKAGVPQLPYVICMGLQLLAAALIFLIPSTEWLDSGGPEDDAVLVVDGESFCLKSAPEPPEARRRPKSTHHFLSRAQHTKQARACCPGARDTHTHTHRSPP